MSNILYQFNSLLLKSSRRDALLNELKKLKYLLCSKASRIIASKDFQECAFLSFIRELVLSLDRSSQIIFYHVLKDIDLKATRTITSLSEEKITLSLDLMIEYFYEKLASFDYNIALKEYGVTRTFVTDVRQPKTDAEIFRIYKVEVPVIKILRTLIKENI